MGNKGEQDRSRMENQMEEHRLSDFSKEPAWGKVSGDRGRLLKRAEWWEGAGHKHCKEVSSLRRG